MSLYEQIYKLCKAVENRDYYYILEGMIAFDKGYFTY